MTPARRHLWAATPPRPRRGGFTMAELLVVMAIITVLAGALAVVLPRIRTRAMRRAARADIEALSNALAQYKEDIGYYPVAPPTVNASGTITGWPALADNVLFRALVDVNAGGNSRGWGGATPQQAFIHKDNIRSYGSNHTANCTNSGKWYVSGVVCPGSHQILDPWGVPYYYIASPDYLRGVRIYDPDDGTYKLGALYANCYGTTWVVGPTDFTGTNHELPPSPYKGPPPRMELFYNSDTFQIHSKGPDQLTDVDDGDPTNIDACDRGTDVDDISNWSN